MGKGLTKGDMFIGAEHFPDRKRPALVIGVGNKCNIIGTFNNEECVEMWIRALKKMFEGVIDDENT